MSGTVEESRSRGSRTRAELRAELGRRDLPRHLALFYESRQAQLDAVAAYLEYGLATDQKCLYLLDVSSPRQIRESLRTVDVDVDARIEAGDLVLRDASEVYLDAGFDPERMTGALEDACEDSLAEGYEGLCVAGENTWCFRTEFSFDHILDFEVGFDAACPDLPVVALCQYDLTRFSEASAAKALWTHENLIYRNTVCENPFYVPPEEYREAANPQLNAKLMLEQAHSLTRSRRQISRHEQRLEVLNRVLRHNIRNDLNVVELQLRMMDQAGAAAIEGGHLDVALEHVRDVMDLAERARYLERSLEASTVEPVDLGSVVDAAIDDVTDACPGVEVGVEGPRDLSVLADANLPVAICEALKSAVDHRDGEHGAPAVSLAISTPTQGKVRVEVPNTGVSEVERRTLEQGRETQLDHVSGLWLWLVEWVVENSHGSLAFRETERGTTLRLELTRVPR